MNELWNLMQIPGWDAMPKIKQLTAYIITGATIYKKELHDAYMRSPIWKICTETQKQFESEQYILQKGFTRIK